MNYREEAAETLRDANALREIANRLEEHAAEMCTRALREEETNEAE